MAKKDAHNDPKKPNIKILQAVRLKGKHLEIGTVVAKKDFPNNGSWQNLCHMDKARAEETADPVGAPKPEKATKGGKKNEPKLPGTE